MRIFSLLSSQKTAYFRQLPLIILIRLGRKWVSCFMALFFFRFNFFFLQYLISPCLKSLVDLLEFLEKVVYSGSNESFEFMDGCWISGHLMSRVDFCFAALGRESWRNENSRWFLISFDIPFKGVNRILQLMFSKRFQIEFQTVRKWRLLFFRSRFASKAEILLHLRINLLMIKRSHNT